MSQELTWAALACSQGLPGLGVGPGSSRAQGVTWAWLGEQPCLPNGAGGSMSALVQVRDALNSPVPAGSPQVQPRAPSPSS